MLSPPDSSSTWISRSLRTTSLPVFSPLLLLLTPAHNPCPQERSPSVWEWGQGREAGPGDRQALPPHLNTPTCRALLLPTDPELLSLEASLWPQGIRIGRMREKGQQMAALLRWMGRRNQPRPEPRETVTGGERISMRPSDRYSLQ